MRSQILYFSPTHSTEKILRALQDGLGIGKCADINITVPKNRQKLESSSEQLDGDVIIIGLPVYGSKPPALVLPTLKNLRGTNKLIVLIGVFGNVQPGDFLGFSWGIIKQDGFKLIATGEFIGEHSFTNKQLKLAPDRPDKEDLEQAKEFGKKIRDKIGNGNFSSIQNLELSSLPLPADYVKNNHAPYMNLPKIDPSICVACGICASNCPVGAISTEDFSISEEICIGCFGCAKICPNHARPVSFNNDAVLQKFRSFEIPRQEPRINL